MTDIPPLYFELQIHTDKVEQVYDYLRKSGQETTPDLYDSVREKAEKALETVEASLEGLDGAELIPEVARRNLAKQANLLLIAAGDIVETGSARVNMFGRYETVETLDQLDTYLGFIAEDFEYIADIPSSEENFENYVLPVLDKYLFDGRDIERAREYSPEVVVYVDRYPENAVVSDEQRALVKGRSDEEISQSALNWLGATAYEIRGQVAELPLRYIPRQERHDRLGYYQKEQNKIITGAEDIVVIHVPGKEGFSKNQTTYQQFWVDYQMMPLEGRPTVIMYNDDPDSDIPLSERHEYEGFLFASGADNLQNTIDVAKDILAAKNKPTFMEAHALSFAQRELYNISNLREWEHHTADTFKSLLYTLDYIKRRKEEGFETKTILDLGTGEGRIAGVMARAGYNVLGVDISSTQLQRIPERIAEEGRGLRGEDTNPALSYNTLLTIQENFPDLLPKGIISNDEEVLRRFVTAEGNFMQTHRVLNRLVAQWSDRFPLTDPLEFFHVPPHKRDTALIEKPGGYFTEFGVDMVTLNWHTFCELGNVDNQKEFLRQALNVMNRGASIVIEIPDRSVGPYALTLKEYHDAHPDEPFGTVRDAIGEEAGQANIVSDEGTGRYFPDRSELILLLQSVGFEINPEEDIQTYLITQPNPDTGKETLQVKELFITARKATA